jgi:hypothetical protein
MLDATKVALFIEAVLVLAILMLALALIERLV